MNREKAGKDLSGKDSFFQQEEVLSRELRRGVRGISGFLSLKKSQQKLLLHFLEVSEAADWYREKGHSPMLDPRIAQDPFRGDWEVIDLLEQEVKVPADLEVQSEKRIDAYDRECSSYEDLLHLVEENPFPSVISFAVREEVYKTTDPLLQVAVVLGRGSDDPQGEIAVYKKSGKGFPFSLTTLRLFYKECRNLTMGYQEGKIRIFFGIRPLENRASLGLPPL